jgi:4-hydroxy-tetrahydrodipicolinate synthase
MIYNNPISYGNDITPEMFAQLSERAELHCAEGSPATRGRITDLHNMVGDRYAIFTGVDDLALESAVLGIDGGSRDRHRVSRENQHLWELMQAGVGARGEIYRWFTPCCTWIRG